jgi:hypothetical protein
MREQQTSDPFRTTNVVSLLESPEILLHRIRGKHPDFQEGFVEGVAQYQHWHQHEEWVGTSTLLFLVRNGWGNNTRTEMWQTGYIVGWLFAFFYHKSTKSSTL